MLRMMDRSRPGVFLRALWLATLCLALTAGARAAPSGYQLTGVIDSSNGTPFAVIEQADGQQRLLKEGDEIGNGQVVSISPSTKSVRLRFPEGEVLLGMDGSAHRDEDDRGRRVVEEPDHSGAHSISRSQSDQLIKLAADAERLGKEESQKRTRELLGLPDDARIVAVDHQRVGSTQELLTTLADRLTPMTGSGGLVGRLSVRTSEGKSRVYLMADFNRDAEAEY